jgi:predicted nucleotidyltransferase component of viral defense system
VIPKAELLAVAAETGLLPTTVEKDYALGWVLFAIADHSLLGRWYFKGGTCLKKCYFDTYRFSEDLDFTVPPDVAYDVNAIQDGLRGVAEWVRERAGLEFPAEGVEVTESINKRGLRTYEARMTFTGPLQLARAQRQRIRFDLTQDEVVLGPDEAREVFHGYTDAPDPLPRVRCYSLGEILAEKVRALVERSGRARDVYDVVNVGRNLRSDLPRDGVAGLAARKFAFKALEPPTPDRILAKVDPEVLATDWTQALRHQLPVLPPVGDFVTALREILEWLLGLAPSAPALASVPARRDEALVPRVPFARPAVVTGSLGLGVRVEAGTWPLGAYGGKMDRVRYAARNRLLARIRYHGVTRVVEPYSLRTPRTGNLLLYVFELERGFGPGEGIKAFKVEELGDVQVMDHAFQPRYLVEL